MRALVFSKELSYRPDYPNHEIKENEALIRILYAGICNTDLEIIEGYMGFEGVPGHEFVGIVERCNEKGLAGKRVVGEINLGCNSCPYCKKGIQNHCPNRSVLGILNKDGAFAEYVTLPVANLHPVPDSITDEEAVFVEPLAAAFEILQQVNIRPDHKVCVLGDGKLGLLAGQVLSLTSCTLTVAGKHEEKLSILKRRGIETAMLSAIAGRKFDVVIDCTGSPSGLETACRIVEPGGTVVLKTTVAEKRQVDLNSIVINEITMLGSRCGPFAPAIHALKMKSVDVHPLISRIFPLEEGVDAFRFASNKGVLKVILKT